MSAASFRHSMYDGTVLLCGPLRDSRGRPQCALPLGHEGDHRTIPEPDSPASDERTGDE